MSNDLLYYRIYKYYSRFPKIIFLLIPLMLFALFTRNDLLVGISWGIMFGTVIHYFLFMKIPYSTPIFDELGNPTEELDRIKEAFES